MKNHIKTFTKILCLASLVFAVYSLFTPRINDTFATTKRKITNIGILIKFSDSDTRNTLHIDDADSLANAEKLLNNDQPIAMQTSAGEISVPSIKKYYETQSYGQLSIVTKLFIYQDAQPMDYYLPKSDTNPNGYDTGNKTIRETELANNAIAAISARIANQSLTLSDLDSDGDGKIDAVTLFIENTTNVPIPTDSIFWPHARTNNGDISAQILNHDISAYCLIYHDGDITKYGTFSLDTGGYGTVAHELGHILGFHDLYRSHTATGKPVGIYDIMGQTTSSNPQNFLAYFISEYRQDTNWHSPLPVITQSTSNLTVTAPRFIDPSEQRAIILQPNTAKNEYFVVEYYAPHDSREGFSGQDQGIIVYRINKDYTSNNDDHVFIFRPEETALGAGQGNIFQAPLNLSRPTLGKALNSNNNFDNQTIYYSDGSNSGLVVTVTSQTDNSITFDVTFPQIAGDGTASRPYQIASTTDFLYLMNGDTKGKYYQLISDLDFANLEYQNLNFYGHLDGQNHTINNISTSGHGIFNFIGGYNSPTSISNLQIKNLVVNPTNGNTLGGLASFAENTTVTNVHLLSGSVTNIAPFLGITTVATGGFIGDVSETVVINNCSSALTVTGQSNLGGFIGRNQNAKINNSQATGKTTGNNYVGGFIGIQCIANENNYNVPQNVNYDATLNSSIPSVGGASSPTSSQITQPSNKLLQGITAITSTPQPEPTPTPSITEAEVLRKLGLTKTQNYLTGFNLGTDISALRIALTSIKGVALLNFQNSSSQNIASGKIATGMKFSLKISNTQYNYIVVILGDVNGDGAIYATDYVKIRNHIMGKSQLSGASLQAADVNRDNKVQATDYVRVRNHIMGKSTIQQK